MARAKGPSIGGPHPYFGYNPHSENEKNIYEQNWKLLRYQSEYKAEIIFFHFLSIGLIAQNKDQQEHPKNSKNKKNKGEEEAKKKDTSARDYLVETLILL